MSKTTILLLTILLVFLGFLLFVVYEPKQNPIITSLTTSKPVESNSSDATLSLITNTPNLHRGQTVTLEVMIHNAIPHPNLVQFELAYDPMMITVISINPGTFFIHPSIALQKIDPIAGRITYALRCTNEVECNNGASTTLATITININPYTIKNNTTISFLPKTVIRTSTNTDILKRTNGLQMILDKLLIPFSSSSAIVSHGTR